MPYGSGLPRQAPVLSLAIDPRDPNRIYAGAYDVPGIYRSLDRARSWHPLADGLGPVPSFSLQFIGDTLYAGTTNGLFRLNNDHWTSVAEIPHVSIYSIARGSDGASYLATDRRGIFTTTDSGKMWTHLPGLENEIVLNVAAPDDQTLIAGTGGHGAFIKYDRGNSWHALDLFTGDYVSFIQIAPSSSSGPGPRDQKTIFLRTRWGLFRTRNLGENWEILQGGIENGVVHALLITPRRLYAATSAGVLVSEDDGASWQQANVGLPENAQPLSFAPIDPDTILVGTQTGVFITHDAGAGWDVVDDGLGAVVVHALAIENSGALIVATEDGLYENDAHGNFHFVGTKSMHVPMLSVAIAPSNPLKIYGGSYRHGIFVSGDGGKTWEQAGDIFHGRLAASGLAVNPGDDGVVFARVLFQRIYKSDDGGETWHAVWTGMSDDTEVETMAIASVDPAIMLAGTNFGAFISRDGGESWTPRGLADASSKWASYRNVFALWIDPRDPRHVLAGATDGLYPSDDMGETWAQAKLNDMTITAIARDARGNFFTGTKYNGVWLGRDGAKTWEHFGMGLDAVSVNALALDDARGVLYAATTRGLFKTFLPPRHEVARDTQE